jgi:phosphohistidine swiveling domain-containing protein
VLAELQSAGFPVPAFVVSPPDLYEALVELGSPLAVRSSASVEDGPGASFAGQFRSYLNVRTPRELEAAVRACRESVHAPSVAAYCERSGIDPSAIRMDVIVQRMIEPQLAGVAFTIDPTTGEERVVIEACEGLADELLSGTKAALPDDHPLVRKFRPQIEALARRVQRHFGAPQDIEFAADEDQVWLLQARPITRIAFAPDMGEWTTADFRDGGVSSGVCSPMMWSLYQFAWERALKGFLRKVHLWRGDFEAARIFFGRPYWNLGAVKACLARLPGFVEREFDNDLNVAPTYEGDGRRTPVTLGGVLRTLPTVWAIRSFFRRQERFDGAFLERGFERIERQYDDLSDDVVASLRRLIERDYLLTETNYFRTIFAVSLAKLDFKQAFGEADYAQLVAGLPPLLHMAPIRALQEMAARNDRDVTRLLRQFRHHTVRGLDVCHPRWDEERHFVSGLFADPPLAGTSSTQAAYEAARARVEMGLRRWKRRRFARKLDRLRRFVWLREQMRDLSSRMYYHIRRHLLMFGADRGIGDDVFFMTFQEVLADDRSQIERRRETYEAFRNFNAPGEIGAGYRTGGEGSFGLSVGKEFDAVAVGGELDAVAVGSGLNELVGIAASRGVVQGVARVARTPQEAARVERGAILVCPFTDPGWTPVLARVGGVVTETGGLLSHAAVICREFGIPAVLGVPAATSRIPDGASITVDANTGRVHLMNTRRNGADR